MRRLLMFGAVFLIGVTVVCAQNKGMRFVNAIPNAPASDVFFNDIEFPLISAIEALSASEVRTEIVPGEYVIAVRENPDGVEDLVQSTITLNQNDRHTVCMLGELSDPAILNMAWNEVLPQAGNVLIRFVHGVGNIESDLEILLSGSQFFAPITRYEASDFVEIPLAQASLISVVESDTDREVARFGDNLEPGNVYTVILAPGLEGIEARLLIESAVDPQSPLQILAPSGTRTFLRAVNLALESPELQWKNADQTMFNEVAPGSATDVRETIVDNDIETRIFDTDNPSVPALQEMTPSEFNNQITFVAHGSITSLQQTTLYWDRIPPDPSQALLRVLQLSPVIGAIDLVDAEEGVLQASISFATATEFLARPAGSNRLSIQLTSSGESIALFDLDLVEGTVLTLLIEGDVDAPIIRALTDSEPLAQEPLPAIQNRPPTNARLRVANVFSMETPLQVISDDVVVDERMEFGFATDMIEGFEEGAAPLEVLDADNPENDPLAEGLSATMEDERYTLSVLYSDNNELKSLDAISLLKLRVPTDSVLVRIAHVAEFRGPLSFFYQEQDRPFIDGLDFGEISDFVPVPEIDRRFVVKNASGRSIAELLDDQPESKTATIVLYEEEGVLRAFVLQDYNEDLDFRPMLDIQVIETGVREWLATESFDIVPNPVSIDAAVRLTLTQAAAVSIGVYDLYGAEVVSIAQGLLSAGEHRFPIAVQKLSQGTYWVRLQSGPDIVHRQFVIVQ